MPDAAHSYTPSGRNAVFAIPAYADVADLRTLFSLFADSAAGYTETPIACATAARPSSPYNNQVIFDTDLKAFYYWNSTDWVSLGGSGGSSSWTTAFLTMGA